MSISINTNIASLQAQNYLRQTENFQQQTIDEVTSGLRIINSGDDAAGLAIANGLRSDQAVLTQGIQNANDGLSTLQTIDGGMTNISQLLDRARTLATESASGTFTGDRSTLDSEFQSVLGEVNRQAQAIGLDSGGQFAKSLSVFIGGGQAQGNSSAIQNGSVSVDLTGATVDTKSLGLSGVQVIGGTAGTTDIGTGSQYTSVSQILSNTANTTAAGGYTSFTFAGPGFSDGSKVAISVNTQNVTDTNSLVTAINDAIQNAGNAGTQAATAFQNANIVASVNTDSTGKQQIAFSSSGTAFQVTAGDRMANALMGQFAGANSSTGAAMATTVTGGANVTLTNLADAAETVKVQFTGAGLTAPLDLGVAVTNGESVQNVVNSLSSAVVNNSTLKAAGITLNPVTSGNPLTFSNSLGQQFNVAAGGDTQNLLGLGTSQLGLSNAVTYDTLAAASPFGPASSGMANLEFSLDGAASGGTSGSVTGTAIGAAVNMTGKTLGLTVDGTQFNVVFNSDPNVGAGETQQQIVNYINSTAQSTLGLGAGVNVASVSSNLITLTSPTAGTSSSVVVAAGAGATALGFTGGATNTGAGNTSVSVSLAGGTATAATMTGSAVGATFATAAFDANLSGVSLGTGSGPTFDTLSLPAFSAALTGATLGVGSGPTFDTLIPGPFSAALTGASLGVGSGPAFDTKTTPPSMTVTIDGTGHTVDFTNDTNAGTSESLADVVSFINSNIGSGNTATLNSSNQIVITSGTTGADSDVQVTHTAFTDALGLTNGADADSGTGAAPAPPSPLPKFTVNIDGTDHTVDFTNDTKAATGESLADVVSFINTSLGSAGTAALNDKNQIVITSATTGADSDVTITNDAFTQAMGLSTSATGTTDSGTGAAPAPPSPLPKFTVSIDGTDHVVDFSTDTKAATNESLSDVVGFINSSLGSAGTATLNDKNQIVIASATSGTDSDVKITDDAFTQALGLTSAASGTTDSGTGAATLTTLGLTVDNQSVTVNFADASNTNAGSAETLDQVAAYINQQAQQQVGTSATIATVVNNAIQLTSGTTGASSLVAVSDSTTAQTLGLTTGAGTVSESGAAPTGADIANRLNQAFAENATLQAAGLQANFANGSFTVSSTNGTNFQLNARGQTGADLGFGTAGAAFMGNTATHANNTTFDAGGSSAVSLAFTGLVNGSDNQAITISATDGSGNVQTKTITLANNATGTSGSTIDQTISAINTALQQSNNPTLQQISAVKENVGGTENINLLSTLGSFNVSLGTTADGTGLSEVVNDVKTQGTTASSTTLAGGSTVAITSQAGAEASVAALATAVTNLGNAQATVGKGENEFNYAINLAQTQNTNEASAESQIRDADMASEAANLTKAQILQQAGIAALAQANSAPQAVLKLLGA